MDTIEYPDYRSNEGRDILREMYQEISQYEKGLRKAQAEHHWSSRWEDEEEFWPDRKLLRHRAKLLEPKKGKIEASRARRIRDKQRMKAKARRIFRQIDGGDMAPGWGVHSNAYSYQLWLKDCEKLADNLAHCSRRCCNRQRYWDGPPMQERRERARTDDMMRRSPHLMGPRRIDPVAEINRRLHRKIHELMRQH